MGKCSPLGELGLLSSRHVADEATSEQLRFGSLSLPQQSTVNKGSLATEHFHRDFAPRQVAAAVGQHSIIP